ncbi:MAG TPA: Stf0 family sulfotransferase [Allosphingosinicella sp.]|nr:Stf0 family sulfotransferase [Allosphingosinicella sp.]
MTPTAPRGYVICSEHRSGSTLLCQLLRSTGKLGQPREYFSDNLVALQVERDAGALDALRERASTPNGVYGLKVFTQQFDGTMKSRWPERLPRLHFVHLSRRDLLGQAISYVRALQTDQFQSYEHAHREPTYDRHAIAGHIARLADNDARWRRYFARNGLSPLWLTYEALSADPAAAVAAVARHIGLDEAVQADASLVEVRVQRDLVSEEWRARFVAESRDLSFLDNRYGQARVWLRRFARDLRYLRASPGPER